jgi:hypothetical protein
LSPSAVTPQHVQPGFLSVSLVMWTVGGVAVLTTLLRQLADREVITVNSLSLSQRIEALGIGITRSNTLSAVRDLRAAPYVNPRYARQRARLPWAGGDGSGSIAFDYGARTIRIAAGIDEAEATMLVADLARRAKVQPPAVSML